MLVVVKKLNVFLDGIKTANEKNKMQYLMMQEVISSPMLCQCYCFQRINLFEIKIKTCYKVPLIIMVAIS